MRRRVIRIASVVVGALVVAVLALAARGARERVDLAAGPAVLRATCLSAEPRSDRVLLDRCYRIRGTLLHVWREHDASGRVVDLHLLVLARFELFVVKVYPPFPAHPRVGGQVEAVGPLVRPHPEHLGIHEVEGFSVSGAGL
jgi:hypothetical protein